MVFQHYIIQYSTKTLSIAHLITWKKYVIIFKWDDVQFKACHYLKHTAR